MKRFFIALAATTFFLIGVTPAWASGGHYYIVQPGDTLYSIADSHGISVDELVAANRLNWDTWIYAGQELMIPVYLSAPLPIEPVTPHRFQTTQPNQFEAPPTAFPTYSQPPTWSPWAGAPTPPQPAPIYANQQVDFYAPPPVIEPVSRPAPVAANSEKWIDVDLTNQKLTAYEGQTPVFTAPVSTGTWQYPTVVGTYNIYVKYEKARMRGGFGADAYDLPNVPYVMYFHKGYGLHGTYWHNNFGTPMSHGCVNLSIPDSEWLFNWASVGTKVVTHY